jgi:uncharacterized protein (TIGR00661 family)
MPVIFYSVSGEGMGHATRSQVIIEHLISKGNKVAIFSYDRAYKYLKEIFSGNKNVLEVVEITGINYIYEKNEFMIGKTIARESRKTRAFVFANSSIYVDRILKYSPVIMITDFEPMAAFTARLLKIPLLCIDNINLITKCKVSPVFARSVQIRLVDYLRIFDGSFNFITTVFNLPIKERYKHNTYVTGPVIRKELIAEKVRIQDFILVYQTSRSNDKLFDVLKRTDERFIVYGFNKASKDGNIILKQGGKDFAKDMLSCKAVITNGGFSLISEAVYLKKPIYSVPVKHQIEQEINGYYIQKKGYGICSKEIRVDRLKYFIANLEKFRKNIPDIEINDFEQIDRRIAILKHSYKGQTRAEILLTIKSNYTKTARKISARINTPNIVKLRDAARNRFRRFEKKLFARK